MENFNPTNILREAVVLHCEVLFDCAADICIVDVGDDEKHGINLVVYSHDHSDRSGEEHDLMTMEQEFLIRCSSVQNLGLIEIPEGTKIYCLTKLNVEVFEVVDDGSQNNFVKHDSFGQCWLIRTNRCETMELDQWPILISEAMN